MKKNSYIGSHEKIPEFTIKAVLLGILLAIILGAANTYLGLYAGMTVSASIPAAVICMGIFRGIFKHGTILENNMVQTIASTGESLAAGIIFTLPALVLAGVWFDFDYWSVTLVALFGGILGIIFMIPMRKTLIIDEKLLKYPEGTACAEVLKAGEGKKTGLIEIAMGIIVGGGLKFFISGLAIFKGTLEGAGRIGSSVFYFGSDISAALVGVGAIVGFNIAVLMLLGGAFGWLVGIPVISAINGEILNNDILDHAWTIWSTKIRYIGVGAMISAGIWSIVKIRHGIIIGLKEIIFSYDKAIMEKTLRTEENMSRKHILSIITLVIGSMFIFYYIKLGSLPTSLISVLLITILSFFLVAVASYICGLVGSSNSPVSGMTIFALLVTSLIFYLLGIKGNFAIIATLLVSGVICCATCTAGDISQDLKTGALVGATPKKQQWGEIIGAFAPAFFFAPILALLHNAYGIGTGEPGSLKAPQAALFASLVKSIFGSESMPWDMIITGIIFAIAVIILDEILIRKKSEFRLYAMPVAVGLYLPFSLAIPILAGGVIELLIKHQKNRDKLSKKEGMNKVVLLSSGLIAGEALMGIMLALLIWLIGVLNWGFKIPLDLSISPIMSTILTVIVALFIVFLIAYKGLIKKD